MTDATPPGPPPPAPRAAPTARSVAADVLVRVERDGAFAAAALEAEIGRAVQLDARDRGLVTELVYGSLRVRPWLEERLASYAARGLGTLDPESRAHLVVAAYQLFFASRIPAFAAVNAAVDLVTHAKGGKKVGAFANAVLRKIAIEAPKDDDARLSLRRHALVASAAPWLREALTRALGDEAAVTFLESAAETPAVSLRVENAGERDAWLAKLGEATKEARFEAGNVSPHAILVRGAGKPQALAGYKEGAWSVQEEGSQLVALALGATEGDVVLDACAGRGNKTSMLARMVGARGAVDAADVHAKKLARLEQELARVGMRARRTFAVDWSVGPGEIDALYDRVLVDAPCSGTGTLRRRPELATRRAPDDFAELAKLQLAILARAAERVRPGGRLVYAVCSVLREEAEDVVAALLRNAPELEAVPFDAAAARAVAGEGASTLRLSPITHGTDGYFVASLGRRLRS